MSKLGKRLIKSAKEAVAIAGVFPYTSVFRKVPTGGSMRDEDLVAGLMAIRYHFALTDMYLPFERTLADAEIFIRKTLKKKEKKSPKVRVKTVK